MGELFRIIETDGFSVVDGPEIFPHFSRHSGQGTRKELKLSTVTFDQGSNGLQTDYGRQLVRGARGTFVRADRKQVCESAGELDSENDRISWRCAPYQI